jgi:integrase
MGLGSFDEVTLADAEQKAADARKLKAAGNDPLAIRDAEQAAKREAISRRVTFERLAADYIGAHGASWSDSWRKGWQRKLELYVYPLIGKCTADAIGTEQVLSVLKPIWHTKTRTADEVRNQIERVLDAAKARGLREGENPARWRGHLDNLLSKEAKKEAKKRQHFPAMNWRDVPALMVKLRADGTLVSAALQLLILTGARSHMARLASWSEFDLGAGVWSLPGERMKMGLPFAVPLTAEVIALLNRLPRIGDSSYLFPGQGRSGVIHGDAMRDKLIAHGAGGLTVHGFRSSFRDWAGERTSFPRELCELALAHDERDQTEGAYSRSDYFEKRRALMADWAAYAATAPAANVIQADFKRA